MPRIPEYFIHNQEQLRRQVLAVTFRFGVGLMAVGSADMISDAVTANSKFLELHPQPVSVAYYKDSLRNKEWYESQIIRNVVAGDLTKAENLAKSPSYRLYLTKIQDYQLQEEVRNKILSQYHGSLSIPYLGITLTGFGFVEAATASLASYLINKRNKFFN